jgi:hypothetical protein
MPSNREIRKLTGSYALSNAVVRSGGFETWAKKLKLPVKPSCTKTGRMWEKRENANFQRMGFETQRQSMLAPFDILVNGKRVDVKAAHLKKHRGWSGYVFAGLKRGAGCDYFDFLILGRKRIRHRLIVPAKEVKTITLSITKGREETKSHPIFVYRDGFKQLEDKT